MRALLTTRREQGSRILQANVPSGKSAQQGFPHALPCVPRHVQSAREARVVGEEVVNLHAGLAVDPANVWTAAGSTARPACKLTTSSPTTRASRADCTWRGTQGKACGKPC